MKKWFSENVLNLLMALLTIVGLWIAYQIPISLNKQDSAERLKEERTARFEADISQVNQVIAGSLGEETNQAASDGVLAKRSAARALSDYASQGRVYAPATSILLHYLEREGDPKTHCYLRLAIDRGLNNKPPALGVGARAADGTALDESNWTTTTTTERARLQALLMKSDTADCLIIPSAEGATVAARTSAYRQYLDVDCARTNENNLHIPIDTTLMGQYKVSSATAAIQDTSNLKSGSGANVTAVQPDGVDVQYVIVGLDRQAFGNCPGGGHGTLVVQFQLVPK
jgi:hypothetical protein